jgi:hypothetical protein
MELTGKALQHPPRFPFLRHGLTVDGVFPPTRPRAPRPSSLRSSAGNKVDVHFSFPSLVRGLFLSIGVRRGLSKGVEDGRSPPALWAGESPNGPKDVSGMARLQGVEG